MSDGTKHDAGKPMMDLLWSPHLVEVAEVFSVGAKKYSRYNWTKGIEFSRLYSALQRHLNAWWMGEENDPETGNSHLAHAGCCLQMLYGMNYLHPELDDRFKRNDDV